MERARFTGEEPAGSARARAGGEGPANGRGGLPGQTKVVQANDDTGCPGRRRGTQASGGAGCRGRRRGVQASGGTRCPNRRRGAQASDGAAGRPGRPANGDTGCRAGQEEPEQTKRARTSGPQANREHSAAERKRADGCGTQGTIRPAAENTKNGACRNSHFGTRHSSV